MSESPRESSDVSVVGQTDFERLKQLASARFLVEEALMDHNLPTFYLKQPQETKQAFLGFLKDLEPLNLIALLRRVDGKIVLRILPKPPVKKSDVRVNWFLFFATVATTFVTGFMLSEGFIDPCVGGASFTVAIMAVLGMHEMSHKLSANKHKIEATPPYFIPGPPAFSGYLGIGTFGAVIMQKSLPPNRDALYDVGSSGPIIGFIVAFIVSIIGLAFSPIRLATGTENFLPSPLIFGLFASFVIRIPQGYYMLLHPVAFAGWVGMIVTMLNLLPAAMLDGGHVARAVFGEKTASILTMLSIVYLAFTGFWPMALFVVFISMSKHPGPLDEVSSLSTKRKALTAFLVVILVLCSLPPQLSL